MRSFVKILYSILITITIVAACLILASDLSAEKRVFLGIVILAIFVSYLIIKSLYKKMFPQSDKDRMFYEILDRKINAKTNGKFNELYKKLYDENYSILKKLKYKVLIPLIILLISIIIYILIFFFKFKIIRLFFDKLSIDEMVTIIDLLLFIPFIIIIFESIIIFRLVLTYKNKLVTLYKENVVSKFINFYNRDLTYQPKVQNPHYFIRKYLKSEFNKHSICNSSVDDYISGKIDGANLEFCNIVVGSINDEYENETSLDRLECFSGIFIEITMKNSTDDEIRITSDEVELAYIKNGLKKIRMDSENFEKKFNTYAKDEVTAMMILTHDVMELLEDFYNTTNIFFDIIVKENKIYIRYFTGPVFEPVIFFDDPMNKYYFLNYYNILETTINLYKLISTKIIKRDF